MVRHSWSLMLLMFSSDFSLKYPRTGLCVKREKESFKHQKYSWPSDVRNWSLNFKCYVHVMKHSLSNLVSMETILLRLLLHLLKVGKRLTVQYWDTYTDASGLTSRTIFFKRLISLWADVKSPTNLASRSRTFFSSFWLAWNHNIQLFTKLPSS